MTNIKSISIPNACLQSWQQMTAVNNGRHCEYCCKTVIDFTKMSDDEVIQYLSAKTNVCGRIGHQQLRDLNTHLYVGSLQATGWWKRIIVIVGMLGPISLKVSGQTRPAIVQTTDTSRNNIRPVDQTATLGKAVLSDSSSYRLIKGVIDAKDDGLPIPGVTIKIKNYNIGTITDQKGEFTLCVPSSADTLVASFVGYVSQHIPVAGLKTNSCNISLDTAMSGGIKVSWIYFPQNIWWRIKWRIKRIFQ